MQKPIVSLSRGGLLETEVFGKQAGSGISSLSIRIVLLLEEECKILIWCRSKIFNFPPSSFMGEAECQAPRV